MTGFIKQRSEGSWSIVIYLGKDPTSGRKKQKWVTFRGNKKQAQAELTRLVHELNTGFYVEPGKLTTAEYLEKWLADFAKPNVSGKTYERYEEIVRRHLIPALGAVPLIKLQPMQIQEYYTSALATGRLKSPGGLSPRTVTHHHRVLREALQRAVKWQLLGRNPVDCVEPPKPARREMKSITEVQTAWLLEVARGTPLYMPSLLAVTTGMRRGEILALRWADVNGSCAIVTRSIEQTNSGVRVKTPKSGKGRRIPLPPITMQALGDHRARQAEVKKQIGSDYQDLDLICCRPNGEIWKPDTFTEDFARLLKRAGLKGVRLHDMRHSHATQLLEHGVHPKVVSERLGHSTVGITLDIYSHVLPTMQDDATQKIDASLSAAIRDLRAAKPV